MSAGSVGFEIVSKSLPTEDGFFKEVPGWCFRRFPVGFQQAVWLTYPVLFGCDGVFKDPAACPETRGRESNTDHGRKSNIAGSKV